MKTNLVVLLFLSVAQNIVAQNNVAINTTGALPDNSSILDINSTNTGLLIPRIVLTSADLSTPVTSPANSLIVFNTATNGTGLNLVTPGYYYWDTPNNRWRRINNESNAWQTNGNYNTIASTSAIGITANNNYIGTNDNIDFVMVTNGLERFRIRNNGNIGIGTLTPNYKLHIFNQGALEPMMVMESNDDISLRIKSNYNSGGIYGENYIEFENPSSGVNGWQFGMNDGSSLLFRYGSLGTFGTGSNNSTTDHKMMITTTGNVKIGGTNSPTEKLDVDGFYKGGILAMGSDCSYEGTNTTEHNDFGCLICVVRSLDGKLYCRSTRDDQEELDQAATNPSLWTAWTDYGNPGPAGTYIEAVDVYIQSTNSDDDCSFCCGGPNDWAGAIMIRLSNGDVYMRSTTSVSGSTNSADACVSEIGGNPSRYTGWTSLGQP